MILLIKIAFILSSIGFFIMMIVFFRTGPRKIADRLMQGAVTASALLHFAYALTVVGVPIERAVIGCALIGLSNLLFWSACSAHGVKRPGAVFGGLAPDAIIATGSYRYIRHPFYLSYIVGFLAMTVFSGCWWLLASDASMLVAYNVAARGEEEMLSGLPQTGAAYRNYLRRSWRWIPFLW